MTKIMDTLIIRKTNNLYISILRNTSYNKLLSNTSLDDIGKPIKDVSWDSS